MLVCGVTYHIVDLEVGYVEIYIFSFTLLENFLDYEILDKINILGVWTTESTANGQKIAEKCGSRLLIKKWSKFD